MDNSKNVVLGSNEKGEKVIKISTKKGEILITKTKHSEVVAIQQNNGVS